MQSLKPYNTLGTLEYITTLAIAYIPTDMVEPLRLGLMNPNSQLYRNPSLPVKTLMDMIDPSIPLLAGQTLNDGSTINGDGTNADGTGDDGSGGPIGSDAESSAPVRPSSVGIALGVAVGAAVYGGAMLLVARRYKQRRSLHKRSSSLIQAGEPRFMGEGRALMTGARGSAGYNTGYRSATPPGGEPGRDSRNSGRTGGSGRTYISPPVMAENSLGWN